MRNRSSSKYLWFEYVSWAWPVKVLLLLILTVSATLNNRKRPQGVALAATFGIAPLPYRIPIGSIFESDSMTQSAFRFELERHNNSTRTTFKLDKYEKTNHVGNNLELIKEMCSTIVKGVFVIFGTTSRVRLRTANAFASRFHMPYITSSAPGFETEAKNDSTTDVDHHQQQRQRQQYLPTPSAFTLYLAPSHYRAVIDLVKAYRLTKVYYVYDTSDGLSRIEFMHKAFNQFDSTVEIDATRIPDVNRCHVLLRQMDAREKIADKFIILDMSSQSALQSVLRQVQNVGMNRANYHYLLASLAMDELDVSDFRHGGANITGFRLVNPEFPRTKEAQKEWWKFGSHYWKEALPGQKIPLEAALTIDAVTSLAGGLTSMLNRDPQALQRIFRRGQVYNDNERGIDCKSDVTSIWTTGNTIMENLLSVNFKGVTGEVAFDRLGRRANFTLDIIEQRQDNPPLKVGTWHQTTGVRFDDAEDENVTIPVSEINRTRIVTSILSNPYLMMKKSKVDEMGVLVTGNDRYEGYCADLAKMLADLLKFPYEMRLVPDEKYGEKMANGTWNGMVGELTTKRADIAIAPLTISSMRERVIDFTKPFMNLGISIMIKKPDKQKPGVFSFMDPLSYEIWMCIVFSYLGVSTVLFLVSRFSPNEWQIEDSIHGPTYVNDFTILNSLWFSLGAFMRRGCEVCPRSLSGRIVGSAWWFFTLIIISSYTANLAAFLTIERMLTPIESADDLAKQTEILYGTLDAGSTKDFFKTSKIPVYQKMWSFMSNEPGVFAKTTEEGIKRVRHAKGKYAFLLESTMNDYANQRKPCNTMKVGDNLDSKGYGIATYLGSDLREPINVAVLYLLEKEYLQKLQKKWWYDKGECVVETDNKGSGSSQSSLSLSNVAGIFYILIGGLGLSMVVASLEFLYKSRMEARRQRYAYSAPSGIVTMNSCFDIGDAHTQV